MDYKKYSIEDFVLDKEFRKWVFSNDNEANKFWNNWIKDNPDRVKDIQKAKSIVKNINFSEHKISSSEKLDMLDSINDRIDSLPIKETTVRHLTVDSYQNNNAYSIGLKVGIAATFLIGISLALFILLKVEFTQFGKLAYKTEFGETKNIILDDGSVVILNSNSKLYVEDFDDNKSDREVWLEGEAFFDITHTLNNQKFIVHANKIDVNVLGTEFNVYSRGTDAQIALASGKVSLLNTITDEIVSLAPGEKVSYEMAYSKHNKVVVNTNDISAWKNNLLLFRRTSLAEIASMLKTSYDIDVFFTGGVSADQYFTGSSPADNIDLLIETLSKSFDLNIVRKEKTIIIKPNN